MRHQELEANAGRAVREDRPAASSGLLAEALVFFPNAADRSLLAIDLGCENVLDSLVLLARGWTVLALTETPRAKSHLLAETPRGRSSRLTVEVGDFNALVLPSADLVYAGTTLSRRPPPAFGPIWSRIVPAVRPDGYFVGRFLGDRDDGSPDAARTFLPRKQVITLLNGFLVELLREREVTGSHEFDVIARRRPGRSRS